MKTINDIIAAASNYEREQISSAMQDYKYMAIEYSVICCCRTLIFVHETSHLEMSEECGHFVFTDETEGYLVVCISGDTCPRGVFETSALDVPDFDSLTFKDLAALKPLYTCSEPYVLVQALMGEYLSFEEHQIEVDARQFLYAESPQLRLERVMSYSQGYSGKYGHELTRVVYEGSVVGYITAYGKYCDEYSIYPVGSLQTWGNMIEWINSNLKPNAEDVIMSSDDDHVDFLDITLRHMYDNSTFSVSE